MKQKAINFIICVVSVPIILYEYFVLLWFWGGSVIFNLILTPTVYATYMISIVYFSKKIQIKSYLALPVKIICVLALPILTMATVWLLAFLFDVEIVIW